MSRISRASLTALTGLVASSVVSAVTLTYSPTPVDLNDLDHHQVYTWRVDGVSLTGQTITSANLKIKQIRNWDTNANKLFIHLLDTAINAGVASFIDDPLNTVPVTDITDDFANARYHGSAGWLVANTTADTFLTSQSFPTTPADFVYNFTASQLTTLAGYISNGNNFALGFDPDCHYFNDGVIFTINTNPSSSVPEPSSILLFAAGLAAIIPAIRRRRQA